MEEQMSSAGTTYRISFRTQDLSLQLTAKTENPAKFPVFPVIHDSKHCEGLGGGKKESRISPVCKDHEVHILEARGHSY